MANIENRRIKRKVLRIAAFVGAGLLLCAAVLAAVLLPKACKNKKGAQNGGAEASASDNAETPAPSITARVSESPVGASEPAASPSPSANDPAPSSALVSTTETPSPSGRPRQTSDERSLAIYSMTVNTYYDNEGLTRKRFEGGCTIAFVNNTDTPMYSAGIALNGFEVLSASVDGAAVRYYVDESGVCVLPFNEELKPGAAVELFIKLYGAFSASDTAVLPHFDYDTVYDAVCCAVSDNALVFSPAGASLSMGEAYEYTLDADGVRQITLSFGEA